MIGFQNGYCAAVCLRCGAVFHTRFPDKEYCSVCAEKKRRADTLRETTAFKKKVSCQNRNTAQNIADICRRAAEKHMTYGEYVAKFGGA